MANEQNLKPGGHKFTREEQAKGGRKKHEGMLHKKAMREIAEEMGRLAIRVKMPDGATEKLTFDEAVVLAQYRAAIGEKASTKAATFIATLKGEMEKKVAIKTDGFIINVADEEEERAIKEIVNREQD